MCELRLNVEAWSDSGMPWHVVVVFGSGLSASWVYGALASRELTELGRRERVGHLSFRDRVRPEFFTARGWRYRALMQAAAWAGLTTAAGLWAFTALG